MTFSPSLVTWRNPRIWRDESPSEIRQLFAKIGWEDNQTDLDPSYIVMSTIVRQHTLECRG